MSKFDPSKSGLNWPITIVLSVIGLIAIGIYYSLHLNLIYDDSASHLDIARRITDNLHPGIVQIGSTWLPLLHILEAPFAANFFLWQSGLAGAIISGAAFIISGLLIFKLLLEFTSEKLLAWLGLLIFVANANMLFMQTTAMFEPLEIATSLICVYFLVRWSKSLRVTDLAYAAIGATLASLANYDGWPLVVASIVFVALRLITSSARRNTEGEVIVFGTLSSFGIFLWLLYNLMIFGNPIYFAFNKYSAFAQQTALAANHLLPAKGNPLLSLQTFTMATVLCCGIIMSVLALAGLIRFIFEKWNKIEDWAILLPLSLFAFNVLALFKGQSVIWTPNLPPYHQDFFNVRYGLLILPTVVIFAAYLTKGSKLLKAIVFTALIAQTTLFYSLIPGQTNHLAFVTLDDNVARTPASTIAAASWLHSHYKGGFILASSADAEPFVFRLAIPLKNLITEGTGTYWTTSLQEPDKYASWIVTSSSLSGDIGSVISAKENFLQHFQIAYENNGFIIFKRVPLQQIQQSGTATIEGVLLDPQGRPMPNIPIASSLAKTVTSAGGSYQLAVPSGLSEVRTPNGDLFHVIASTNQVVTRDGQAYPQGNPTPKLTFYPMDYQLMNYLGRKL